MYGYNGYYGSCWPRQQIPLSQMCCYQNCLSNPPATSSNPPATTPPSSTPPSVPPTRAGPSSEPPKMQPPDDEPLDPPIDTPPEEEEIPDEEIPVSMEIPLEESDVFAESIVPTENMMEAPFDEDPIPILEDRTLTPASEYGNFKPTGKANRPIGTRLPWNGRPLPWRGKTKKELCYMFFPEGNSNLIGLHDLYNKIKPFRDEMNPRVAEIERWNLEVLRHFRRLIGNKAPFEYDQNLMLQARWSDERKYSKQWDAAYPTSHPKPKGGGPCPTGSGAHCGWLFLPNCMDQQSYLEQYPGLECITNPLGNGGHAEGIGGVPTDLSWANKVASVLRLFLCQDGTEAHMGPIFGNNWGGTGGTYKSGRTTVGISFYNRGNNRTSVRFKWGGKI